jgi:hypothetical protein
MQAVLEVNIGLSVALLPEGGLVRIVNGFLDVGRGDPCAVREIEDLDVEVAEVIVTAEPVIAYDKGIDVELADDLGVIKGVLRDDHVRGFEGFDDLQAFVERDDGVGFVGTYQFIGTNPDDEDVPQRTGVVDHPEMIVVEHIEGSRGVDDGLLFEHRQAI